MAVVIAAPPLHTVILALPITSYHETPISIPIDEYIAASGRPLTTNDVAVLDRYDDPIAGSALKFPAVMDVLPPPEVMRDGLGADVDRVKLCDYFRCQRESAPVGRKVQGASLTQAAHGGLNQRDLVTLYVELDLRALGIREGGRVQEDQIELQAATIQKGRRASGSRICWCVNRQATARFNAKALKEIDLYQPHPCARL